MKQKKAFAMIALGIGAIYLVSHRARTVVTPPVPIQDLDPRDRLPPSPLTPLSPGIAPDLPPHAQEVMTDTCYGFGPQGQCLPKIRFSGDNDPRVYTGGTPNFDETTGRYVALTGDYVVTQA